MKTDEIVIDILRTELAIPAGRVIRHEDHIEDDLGADSLDVIELVMWIEEECNITMSDEDTEHVKTVGDLIKLTGELQLKQIGE